MKEGGRFLSPSVLPGRNGVRTAPSRKDFKLCANYETMFSDTRPRNLKVKAYSKPSSPSPGQPSVKEVDDKKCLMQVQGSHRTLFYRQPSRKHVSSYSTVVVDLEDEKGSSKKVTFGSDSDPSMFEGILEKEKPSVVITFPVNAEKVVTRGTQTDFRESEAQTLPWKHEIRAEGKVYAELMSLEWFNCERNFPPGIEEVTLIEKARQKLAWENVIARMRGKENEDKRKFLVVKMAAGETAFREKKIEEANRERINMSKRQMEEAKKKFEERLLERLQRSYGFRRAENDLKILYWNHQLTRKLRKIKSARIQPTIKPSKTDIIEFHKDKTSELYAPKLRDGENPSRGHETIDIHCRYLKRFHGLKILENYLSNILEPKFLGFNYEEASKPRKIQLCLKKYREKAIEVPEEENLREPLTLKTKVPAPTPEPSPTPQTTQIRSDEDEDLYQASLLLEKLIKGRAIQTRKFLHFSRILSLQ